jgi:flavin reductase (DIM6/NTAB) family NADH-FMN oxidoreductase RutF
MKKVQLGPRTLLYPMPAFLIGAEVDGKPNFMAAAWSGIACSNPPMLTVALQHHRFTLRGIGQNGTFSVNVPSTDMVKETDYCGIVSGAKEDKVAACSFQVFYGVLKTAPMVEQYPVNLECKLMHSLHLGSHALLVGQIEEVHVSEDCLSGGEPDVLKIKPLIYCTGEEKTYYAFGQRLAEAFSVGLEIKKAGKN